MLHTMEEILKNLSCHNISIRFFARRQVRMRHWIGAVLRNNFLYAAEHVLNEEGISLRQLLEKLPLPEEHFLYKQLCGGFPKGFFFDCSHLPCANSEFILEADKVYTVSLVVIGRCIKYRYLFAKAVWQMFSRGFGHPVVPMEVVDIDEQEVCCSSSVVASEKVLDVEFQFETPVCLMHLPQEEGGGFQNKLNNFPSFYQMVRSLAYRVLTLHMLYGEKAGLENREQMDEWIEQYVGLSTKAILLRADLRYEKRYSTPKKGTPRVYVLTGYMGRLVWGNVSASYLPLLVLGSYLGVGFHINYGFGKFCIHYKA